MKEYGDEFVVRNGDAYSVKRGLKEELRKENDEFYPLGSYTGLLREYEKGADQTDHLIKSIFAVSKKEYRHKSDYDTLREQREEAIAEFLGEECTAYQYTDEKECFFLDEEKELDIYVMNKSEIDICVWDIAKDLMDGDHPIPLEDWLAIGISMEKAKQLMEYKKKNWSFHGTLSLDDQKKLIHHFIQQKGALGTICFVFGTRYEKIGDFYIIPTAETQKNFIKMQLK